VPGGNRVHGLTSTRLTTPWRSPGRMQPVASLRARCRVGRMASTLPLAVDGHARRPGEPHRPPQPSPSGSEVWMLQHAGNTVVVIDDHHHAPATISVEQSPRGIAAGGAVWVACGRKHLHARGSVSFSPTVLSVPGRPMAWPSPGQVWGSADMRTLCRSSAARRGPRLSPRMVIGLLAVCRWTPPQAPNVSPAGGGALHVVVPRGTGHSGLRQALDTRSRQPAPGQRRTA
jgi:hypothetical protein